MRYLYYVAAPFSLLGIYLRLKPNSITTLSNLTAALALCFIFLGNSPWYFFFLWNLSLLFDISDGTVARATKQFSANGGFYDHYSDFVKIGLLCLGISIRYPTVLTQVIAFLTLLVFGFLNGVNERLDNKNIPSTQNENNLSQTLQGSGLKFQFKRTFPVVFLMLKGIRNSLVIVQGQLVFVLSFASFSEITAQITIGWFGLMSLRASVHMVSDLCRISRLESAARGASN